MNNDWNSEFIKALASFGSTELEPHEYRLHYNDQGDIVMLSMINHPDNQQYIVVSREIYDNYTQYLVNPTLKIAEKVATNLGVSVKLKSSTQGYSVVKNHAGLLVEPNETYPIIEYYAAVN